MRVYIGADHRGFELKEKLVSWMEGEDYEVVDLGANILDPEDDYTEFAVKVAKAVAGEQGARGILLCGSGHGVDIVANRFHEVRSILGFNRDVVIQGRQHEDANVLSIPAEWISEEEAREMVEVFMRTEFLAKNKYIRRLREVGTVGD